MHFLQEICYIVNKLIKIVLCETSHPGNIGATARAMKNMGLNQLVLVAPRQFPDKEAFDRASGADDVLHAATIAPTLEEALKDTHWVFGTSARKREFPWPLLYVREAAEKIRDIPNSESVAIVFGTERSGLSNEQLQLCDFHITIPADERYASLNLAQAVQVITYELYASQVLQPLNTEFAQKASRNEIEGLIGHFDEAARQIGFFNPKNPKKFYPRLRRMIAKAQLEQDEVNILRGFLKLVIEQQS